MRHKILTVDDSKTVRIIVRKAFKAFDCEILEAANGVEGLALAAKESPALILLDVTMPVMDGVEMLAKLKADPALKGIPVMMLTAEGGRDNVLKIAKMGIRDYIVKPFKEETLVEKAGRIVELSSLAQAPTKAKSIFDAATVLVVEDKPAIVQQIQDGLKHTPWKVIGVATQGEACEFIAKTPPDLIVISLSLANEAAFTLFRLLRANPKSKTTPVFGLVVKTETTLQQQALAAGFFAVIAKPIDFIDLEGRMAKAMNLNTSERYFTADGDFTVMQIPESCSPLVIGEISSHMKSQFAAAVDAGRNKAIIDAHQLKGLHMGVIKLLLQAMQTCRELGVRYTLVGNPQIVEECKGFEDTRSWSFQNSLAEAREHLSRAPALAETV
ncbi:MAG: response regulator [Candidatus Didemnitutus sp.]|nr:response regulator [Candidatus Didemnitutus sp.]